MNHDWEQLKDFREFRGDVDDAIVYVITGPHDGGMIMLILDPTELYARVEIHHEATITSVDVERIKAFVPEREWHQL